MEFLTTRKRNLENAPDVTPKDPINTTNVKNHGAKAENVFFSLDISPTLT